MPSSASTAQALLIRGWQASCRSLRLTGTCVQLPSGPGTSAQLCSEVLSASLALRAEALSLVSWLPSCLQAQPWSLHERQLPPGCAHVADDLDHLHTLETQAQAVAVGQGAIQVSTVLRPISRAGRALRALLS